MNTLTLKNAESNEKVVALSSEGIVRPVAFTDQDATHQCVVEGDILIYKRVGSAKMSYNKYGDTKSRVLARNVSVDTKTLDAISAWLDNSETHLPVGLGWNGQDTIRTVALKLGLDIFLTGLTGEAVLGGLMGLDTSVTKPKVGSFDVPKLFKWSNIHIPNVATQVQIDRLVSGLEKNYGEWLIKNGVCLHNQSKSWRYAKQLPETLSVSCILDDNGKPIRFNDLVVWRDLDEEPEIISVFDLVTTFKMNTNFITLPYVIDEEVKRIMYVLHDKTLSDDGENVVWLYTRR